MLGQSTKKLEMSLGGHTLQLFHKNIFMLTYQIHDFNHLTQADYNADVMAIDLRSCECPVCRKCRLIFYGYYFRNVFFLDRPLAQSWLRLKVHRVYCKQCRSTHAVLPEIAIPYSPFLLQDTLRLLSADSEEQEEILINHPSLSPQRFTSLRAAFHARCPIPPDDLPEMLFSDLLKICLCQYLHQHMAVRFRRSSDGHCWYIREELIL